MRKICVIEIKRNKCFLLCSNTSKEGHRGTLFIQFYLETHNSSRARWASFLRTRRRTGTSSEGTLESTIILVPAKVFGLLGASEEEGLGFSVTLKGPEPHSSSSCHNRRCTGISSEETLESIVILAPAKVFGWLGACGVPLVAGVTGNRGSFVAAGIRHPGLGSVRSLYISLWMCGGFRPALPVLFLGATGGTGSDRLIGTFVASFGGMTFSYSGGLA